MTNELIISSLISRDTFLSVLTGLIFVSAAAVAYAIPPMFSHYVRKCSKVHVFATCYSNHLLSSYINFTLDVIALFVISLAFIAVFTHLKVYKIKLSAI